MGATAYTAAEVAFLLREPIKAVKKALDDGLVEANIVANQGLALCGKLHGPTSSTCLPSAR